MQKDVKMVGIPAVGLPVIRPAAENDLETLLTLESRSFSVPWNAAALLSHLAANHTLSLLLLEGDAPAGYLLAGFTPPEGDLYRVAVLPEKRRRGYGRLLLDAFLAAAGERAVDTLWLDVRESNEAAIALYRSFGFDVVLKRENYYRDPTEAAFVMTAKRPKETP